MELCGEYMLCILAIQNTKLIVIAMRLCLPLYMFRHCILITYTCICNMHAATGTYTSGKILIAFVTENNPGQVQHAST